MWCAATDVRLEWALVESSSYCRWGMTACDVPGCHVVPVMMYCKDTDGDLEWVLVNFGAKYMTLQGIDLWDEKK